MAEPKTTAELTEIWIEGQIIAGDLIKHGEGFSKLLGDALKCADPYNAAQIKHAFPEYWNEEEIKEAIGKHLHKFTGAGYNRESMWPYLDKVDHEVTFSDEGSFEYVEGPEEA